MKPAAFFLLIVSTNFAIGCAIYLLIVLFTPAHACPDLQYIDELAQETVQSLDSCIEDVQRLGIETLECGYAATAPKVIWQTVNATTCTLSSSQKQNLISMDFALEAYKQVLAQGDVK